MRHIFVALVLAGYQLSIGVSCPHECTCTEAQLHVRCHSNEIPRNIPPSTKKLSLNGLNMDHIPKFAFGSLRNLTYLSIEGGNINVLINDTFFGLSSLEVLNIVETHTLSIQKDAFSNLPAIRNISFKNNHDIGFKTFGDSLYSLRNSSTLRHMDLTKISLFDNVLESSFFRYFLRTKIKTLILSRNFIGVLRPGFSRYIRNIQTIVLSYNFIIGTNLAFYECYFLLQLRLLDVSYQRFDKRHERSLDLNSKGPMHYNSLRGNIDSWINNVCKDAPVVYIPPRLEFLYLESSNGFIIGKTCFPSNSLKVLDLSGSVVVRIDGEMMGLIHLEVLKIRNCQCSTIPLDVFQYFPELHLLDLGLNRLSSFIHADNGSLLGNNHRLTSLDISLNGLEYLPTRFLKSISQINVLHVAGNNIRTIDGFNELQNLSILNVADNAISNIGNTDFETLRLLSANRPKLTLFLSRNPMTTVSICCEIYQFIIWSKQSEAQIGDLQNYTCLSNSRFVLFIELSESMLKQQCQISYIDKSFILVSSTLALIFLVVIVGSFSYRYRWKIRWLALTSMRILHRNREVDDQTLYVFDAFISFHVDDIKWVKENLIVELEEKRGLRLCIHHRDFPPSRSIEENIVDAIEASRKTILVLSSNFVKSNWCHFEVQMARNKLIEKGYDVIVPILLGDFDLNMSSRTLRNILTSNTYLTWEADVDDDMSREPFWNMLHDTVKDKSKNILKL